MLGAPLLFAVPRLAPVDAYAALLAEEHAAIHLYGIVAPRLPESLRDAARAAYDDHRRHRDYLVDAVRRAGGVPAPAKATYALPFAATGPVSARALALRIEDSLALRWHETVRGAAPGDRAYAATALGDEAVHLAYLRWSEHHAAGAAAVAFPGR